MDNIDEVVRKLKEANIKFLSEPFDAAGVVRIAFSKTLMAYSLNWFREAGVTPLRRGENIVAQHVYTAYVTGADRGSGPGFNQSSA